MTEDSSAPKIENTKKKNNNKKRKAPSCFLGDSDSPFRKAYQNFSYTRIPPTDKPGETHSFFKESYLVSFFVNDEHNVVENDDSNGSVQRRQQKEQIVHKHANGLCIITAATSIELQSGSVATSSIPDTVMEVLVQPSPTANQSRKKKRNQASKMLKGKNLDGGEPSEKGIATNSATVQPSDILVTLTSKTAASTQTPQALDSRSSGVCHQPNDGNDNMDGSHCHCLYSCVWGTVLEVNARLNLEILKKDPLLDGYIAIVLPTGPFPPPPLPPPPPANSSLFQGGGEKE